MNIGIDIACDVLRFCRQDGLKAGIEERFAVVGVPPRLARESFAWDSVKTARSSGVRNAATLADAWSLFAKDEKSVFEWQYESGALGQRAISDLIGECLVHTVHGSRSTKAVVAVDNTLPEDRQEALLQSLSTAGAGDVELLWRPVAIVLAYLESVTPQRHKQGDKLLVIDAESTQPEVTQVTLQEHRGRLVPLRSSPRDAPALTAGWGSFSFRRQIAGSLSGDPMIVAQLLSGPFADQFVAFSEGRQCEDAWCRVGAGHVAVRLSSSQATATRERAMGAISPTAIRKQLGEMYSLGDMSAVLWHGWPIRAVNLANRRPNEIVLGPDIVARGAAVYGSRLLAGEPTYLDTLPGLYILSKVQELETYAFFHLVKPGVWEGGQVWRREEPLTRFSVAKDVAEFTAVLRRSDETRCRSVVTTIPPPSQDTPVIVRAEMKPAHGRARVTIEGAEGYENVFGESRIVALDWKRMEEIDNPLFSAPAVYPVRGRLFDDGEYLDIVTAFLEDDRATPYTEVEYRGHDIAFWKLMEPWGLSPPWGRDAQWVKEPTRGMFGSEYIPGREDVAQQLAQRINKTVHTHDRVKFLNYMFVYAPESFKEELRQKYRAERPDFVSWNWVIAPGRVFSVRRDIELFLEFMTRIGHGAYPVYPDASYTKHYWWSFFRCLCYHQDAVNVSQQHILDVLEMLHTCVEDGHMEGSVAKYCLCGILFSTRLRTRVPDFLQPGENLCGRLAADVADRFPKVNYPPAMLHQVNDPHGEGLNGFVLRFLMQTASEQDFLALEGLTTSMA